MTLDVGHIDNLVDTALGDFENIIAGFKGPLSDLSVLTLVQVPQGHSPGSFSTQANGKVDLCVFDGHALELAFK